MDYRVARTVFAAHVTQQTPFRFQTDAKFDAQSRSTVEISHIALSCPPSSSSSTTTSSSSDDDNNNNNNNPVFVQLQTLAAPSGAVERYTIAVLTPKHPVASGLRIRVDVDGYAEFHVTSVGGSSSVPSVVLYGLQLREEVQENDDQDMFDTFDEGLFRLIGGLQE